MALKSSIRVELLAINVVIIELNTLEALMTFESS
jgi:hypothetical protein